MDSTRGLNNLVINNTPSSLNNKFGLKLLKCLQSDVPENCLISPLSIITALSKIYIGSREETAKQIEDALDLTSSPWYGKGAHIFGLLLYSFMNVSRSRKDHQLKLACRLYGQKGLDYKSEHLIGRVDFMNDPEASLNTINAWVKEETAGKFQKLLTPGIVSIKSRLVSVNAISFKGEWKAGFDERNTLYRPFRLSSTHSKTVPMMNEKGKFGFFHDIPNECKILIIGKDSEEFNMMIVLPDIITGLADLEEKLSEDLLKSWSNKTQQANVTVFLPKFRFSKTYSMVDSLKQLGISDLFQSEKADLSGITEDEIVVSEVIHKAHIEFTENTRDHVTTLLETKENTLAKSSARSRSGPNVFKADHPFIVFIRDQTGIILFIGRILCPVLEQEIRSM